MKHRGDLEKQDKKRTIAIAYLANIPDCVPATAGERTTTPAHVLKTAHCTENVGCTLHTMLAKVLCLGVKGR